MRRTPGNDLLLGAVAGRNASLGLSRSQRDKHLYVCGSTGTGKSKFLENLIRQDIRNWRKSKCGLLVLDPHGSLYDGLINWLAWNEVDRPIIPIDLRQDDWVVSYNVLRQRKTADPAVLIDNLIEAIGYVWGQIGTDQTPLFEQWAGNILIALYEKRLTLLESEILLNRLGKRARSAITSDLRDVMARLDWSFIDSLSPKDFDAQLGSTNRRMRRFVKTQAIRAMFGVEDVSLDLGQAIEEGAIILVNLATERARISKENSELFATLLLSDLWTAAQERGKRERQKPFYVYLDEFQRFITPTIADSLDQARGFGLHLTMAHQFPNQLLDRGESGKRVYNSIMENASSKIVFRLQHDENLKALAQLLYMGVLDPDKIKLKLYSRKVMDYVEEQRTAYGSSRSSGSGGGSQYGSASGSGRGGTNNYDYWNQFTDSSRSWSTFSSGSGSYSDSWADSESTSEMTTSVLVPQMGEELSHVQFESIDEQIFRSMAVLQSQQERNCVARLVGMRAPAAIQTPDVMKRPGSPERTKRFLEKCYAKWPFALSLLDVQDRISERAAKFAQLINYELVDDSTTAKRRIR